MSMLIVQEIHGGRAGTNGEAAAGERIMIH
jgi:hypothetical protein